MKKHGPVATVRIAAPVASEVKRGYYFLISAEIGVQHSTRNVHVKS
jgi:hypothetical protein